MLHGIKRAVGIYKTSDEVVDGDFSQLEGELKQLIKYVGKVLTNFEECNLAWEMIKKNSSGMMEASLSVCTESWTKELIQTATTDISWLSMGETKSEAITFLKEFKSFSQRLEKDIKKRHDKLKDLNYYKAKLEEFQKSTKNKELEKTSKAESDMEKAAIDYDHINEDTKSKLRYAVELKPIITGKVLLTFLESQASIMCNCPYVNYIEKYSKTMRDGWPQIILNRSNSMTSTKQLPVLPRPSRPKISNQKQARALYDFTAETNEEISFSVGDMITIIKPIDNNWLQGSANGKTGIFPINFIEFV